MSDRFADLRARMQQRMEASRKAIEEQRNAPPKQYPVFGCLCSMRERCDICDPPTPQQLEQRKAVATRRMERKAAIDRLVVAATRAYEVLMDYSEEWYELGAALAAFEKEAVDET